MLDLNIQDDLERLATGECSIAEQQDALSQCEAAPALYRKLALAVMEHHRILGALNHGTMERSLPDASDSRQGVPTIHNSSPIWNRYALAASLLLSCSLMAMGAGYLAGNTAWHTAPKTSPANENPRVGTPIVVQVKENVAEPEFSLGSGISPLLNGEAITLLRSRGFRPNEQLNVEWIQDQQGYSQPALNRVLTVEREY